MNWKMNFNLKMIMMIYIRKDSSLLQEIYLAKKYKSKTKTKAP
jgi:hypothetical protein